MHILIAVLVAIRNAQSTIHALLLQKQYTHHLNHLENVQGELKGSLTFLQASR